MSTIPEQLVDIHIKALDFIIGVKKLQIDLIKRSNRIKEGMIILHDQDLKPCQFGTATTYKNGKSIMIRVYRLYDNRVVLVPMN